MRAAAPSGDHLRDEAEIAKRYFGSFADDYHRGDERARAIPTVEV